jgi:hypothetical protein
MSLSDWQKNGWLQEHQTSPEEIGGLLALVERDLADAEAEGLSADWRMAIAYNAALQAATAALAAAGYRATRDQHHYRVIQSLRDTVGVDAPKVNTFDVFRKKRNAAGYERAGIISDTDATAMRDFAQSLGDQVVRWLKKNHPALLERSGP